MTEEKEPGGPVITIGGPHGSGRSTVAKAVAEHFDLRHFSTGKVFREVARERGLSVSDLNESAEKEVDLEVDRRSKSEAEKGGVVIESDLAAWMNPDADVKIWLKASLEERARRIYEDKKERVGEKYSSLEEAKRTVKKRDQEDKRRYREYYDIDLKDTSIYDLVVDTEELTPEEVINTVVEYIEDIIGG